MEIEINSHMLHGCDIRGIAGRDLTPVVVAIDKVFAEEDLLAMIRD